MVQSSTLSSDRLEIHRPGGVSLCLVVLVVEALAIINQYSNCVGAEVTRLISELAITGRSYCTGLTFQAHNRVGASNTVRQPPTQRGKAAEDWPHSKTWRSPGALGRRDSVLECGQSSAAFDQPGGNN